MTFDQVRELVRTAVADHKGTRSNDTGLSKWCDEHKLHKTSVSAFMNGKVGPPADMLDALGLHWTIAPKDEAHSLPDPYLEMVQAIREITLGNRAGGSSSLDKLCPAPRE